MIFTELKCRDDLANLLGIKVASLTYVLYIAKVDSFYHTFDIPKKNGGVRHINAPDGQLKTIQKRLATVLSNYIKDLRQQKNIHINISHAFEKKKSIITNAQIHRNKYIVLNFDLEHFFDSFHFGRVAGYFEKNKDFKLPHDIAIIIAQLTCYKKHLPQGAPTSPIITNLICQIFDMHILKLAKKYKLDYTRYADDLTFSTNDHCFIEKKEKFQEELKEEVAKAGFSINQKKTRMSLRDNRQEVTGLIVNQKINVSADYYRKTRAMAYQLYQTGSFIIDGKEGTISQLEGRFAFINQLNHYNNMIDGKKHSFKTLGGREKQYSKFLFYKYFYVHNKPLIITEGKTDIRYLKAALKRLYKNYPKLVSRDSDNKFHYNVQFLHKTKRLLHFLGITQDGANTLKYIYDFFCDGKDPSHSNYYKYFLTVGTTIPKHPVVLLFDNEMKTNRPLTDCLNYINANDREKDEISQKLFLHLTPPSNLYLLTNPLTEGKNECEIEFLFKSDTRNIKLNGKELCLKSSYDTNKYYGKDIFSQYILQHYEKIDFNGFIPLLDALSNIIKDYSAEAMNQ